MKNLFKLFIVAIAAFAFTSCGAPSTPSDVVLKYYKAIENGDFVKAAEYFRLEPEQGLTAEKLGEKLASANQGTIMTSYEIIEETISESGTTAKVKVKTTATVESSGKESEKNSTINLSLNDGVWCLELM